MTYFLIKAIEEPLLEFVSGLQIQRDFVGHVSIDARLNLKSINHPISHSINQSFDQPFNQSIDRSTPLSSFIAINYFINSN